MKLSMESADGEYIEVRFDIKQDSHGPGIDYDPANYNHPSLMVIDGSEVQKIYDHSDFSSDIHDDWVSYTVVFDGMTGYLGFDIYSVGSIDLSKTDDALVGASVDFVHFGTYGWFTGHYGYVDNVSVTGSTSLEPETPVSTGFSMPIGDRNGLAVTEAREGEDGWLDGWYNASDLGDPHPSVPGANHLGEDWNLDDLDGDGADEDDTGQAVYAAAVGRVVYVGEYYGASGPSLGFGQAVVIEHLLPDGERIYSLYAHLQEGSIIVEEDQIIDGEGFQIGAIGQTGAAQDGPHLHLELFSVNNSTGAYENAPWLLAMEEFAYTTENIAFDAAFHTINYQKGSVTWYDPCLTSAPMGPNRAV